MTAQLNRTLALRIRAGKIEVVGGAVDLGVVLDHDSVLNDRDARSGDLRVAVEFGGREVDVVRLPITGRRTSVYERRRLAVDRTASAVGIVVDLEGVKYLDLVSAEQDDAVVALVPPISLEIRGRQPFKV